MLGRVCSDEATRRRETDSFSPSLGKEGDKRGVTRRKAQAGPPDSARPTRGQDEAAGNGGGGPEQC